jgi:hypothetical protein
MSVLTSFFLKLSIVIRNLPAYLAERRTQANVVAAQRGSLTLEQIIWTVAIAVVAIAIVAIVVNAINAKAGELPL